MRLSLADKEKIQNLRLKGFTYTEIQEITGFIVPKSSLSYICRNVSLPLSYKLRVETINKQHLLSARVLAVAKNKELQQKRIDLLALAAGKILERSVSIESLKVALAMLYLGEGSKWRSYRGLSLGSSDPEIVSLYIRLLEKCYGISVGKLRARVQHRMDQGADSLVDYWSDVTRIPKSQFYKSYADRRTVGKPTKRSEYRGVCVIMCSGTEVQLELAAIAKQLLKHIDP